MSETNTWPRERSMLRLLHVHRDCDAVSLQLDLVFIIHPKLSEDSARESGRWRNYQYCYCDYSRVLLTATLVLLWQHSLTKGVHASDVDHNCYGNRVLRMPVLRARVSISRWLLRDDYSVARGKLHPNMRGNNSPVYVIEPAEPAYLLVLLCSDLRVLFHRLQWCLFKRTRTQETRKRKEETDLANRERNRQLISGRWKWGLNGTSLPRAA